MNNQVLLIGRIVSVDDETIGDINQKKVRISVTRDYKNADGIYDIDIISVYIRNDNLNILEIGSIIGIRGKLKNIGKEDSPIIIAEKVTILTRKSNDENNKNNEEE